MHVIGMEERSQENSRPLSALQMENIELIKVFLGGYFMIMLREGWNVVGEAYIEHAGWVEAACFDRRQSEKVGEILWTQKY